ncbi:FtsW/RodA/SpoVE family cell division protein [Listeria weihenstephanensis FSL R9-0317]|nr:FtsW/RodA/SpoVE family cell division protein [Listeria weihenstephanensis FSL R9-0317]
MIFFHVLQNIGMTIGMLPITGIPLLFISYGGSAMLGSLMAIGLVLSARYNAPKAMDL